MLHNKVLQFLGIIYLFRQTPSVQEFYFGLLTLERTSAYVRI
jgi:hypothetical protein